MLKIKDNVNLKELEKFGFKKVSESVWQYITSKDIILRRIHSEKKIKKEIETNTISVVGPERKILVDTSLEFNIDVTFCYASMYVRELNVLYDLIKADMVEKVEV